MGALGDLTEEQQDLRSNSHLQITLDATWTADSVGKGGNRVASQEVREVSGLFFVLFLIEVQLIYNTMLISGVHHDNSVYMHIYICVCVCILFPSRLLQNIEDSSLCYIIGPSWLWQLVINFYYVSMVLSSLSMPSHKSFHFHFHKHTQKKPQSFTLPFRLRNQGFGLLKWFVKWLV